MSNSLTLQEPRLDLDNLMATWTGLEIWHATTHGGAFTLLVQIPYVTHQLTYTYVDTAGLGTDWYRDRRYGPGPTYDAFSSSWPVSPNGATDYCTVDDVKDMLGGQLGPDTQTGVGGGGGSSRDSILATLVTRCSRMFDRETGRATNNWAPATGITKPYSGSGNQYLEIDEFNAITAVTMTSNQQRTDTQTLTVTDPTSPNFVEILPLQGPPFNQLFLLRGWLPDVYNVGNVRVTGDTLTPPEITHAVAVWAAYEWNARKAGYADAAARPDGPGLLFVKGIPPETARIIKYYQDSHRGPSLALVGGAEPRLSPWLGWRTL